MTESKMATESVESPDGFSEPDLGGPDEGDAMELEAGEKMTGLLLQIKSGESDNGLWHRITVKTEEGEKRELFAEGQTKAAITQGKLEEGDAFWQHKEQFTEDYTDDDGTVHEFNPVRCQTAD